MSTEPLLTHGDWERAKSRADVAGYACALAVLSGDFEAARGYAEKAKALTEEMLRISAALDTEEPA